MSTQSHSKEFQQIAWDEQLRSEWARLLRLAIQEDLADTGDWTTRALVSEDAEGAARVVARQPGVVAGLPGVECTLHEIEPRLAWSAEVKDGRAVAPGDCLGRIHGPARGILTAERIVLNLLGRLSGIATLTWQYVEAVRGAEARIYDTRKTTPGWRRLEKYAVRCGGGCTHRTGLFDAVLIKDNHLALGAEAVGTARYTPAEAVKLARRFTREHGAGDMIIEIEVDTLDQLDEVLSVGPDLVLLDNMDPLTLRNAVARRDAVDPAIELEASGAVDLAAVGPIAQSGVDRISVGALTHCAARVDLALDWGS